MSREIGLRDALVLVPLVACILALSLYPQLILERTDPSVEQTIAKVNQEAAPEAKLAEGPSPIGPLTVQEAREIIQSAPAPESRPVVGEKP